MRDIVNIIGWVLILFAIIMFVVEIWMLNNPPDTESEYYLKSFPSNSFSWFHYKFHSLLMGIVLLALNKFTNLFS